MSTNRSNEPAACIDAKRTFQAYPSHKGPAFDENGRRSPSWIYVQETPTVRSKRVEQKSRMDRDSRWGGILGIPSPTDISESCIQASCPK